MATALAVEQPFSSDEKQRRSEATVHWSPSPMYVGAVLSGGAEPFLILGASLCAAASRAQLQYSCNTSVFSCSYLTCVYHSACLVYHCVALSVPLSLVPCLLASLLHPQHR